MREVAADIRAWLERGERLALATLVHVQRSAPRLPGAHCAVAESGAMVGAISAGCVESDLIEWSRSVVAGGSPRVISYDVADADAMRIGLTCGGMIEVLVESLSDHGGAWDKVLDCIERDQAVALAVAVSPDDLRGRRMFLTDDTAGTIDPAVDAAVVEAMRQQLIVGGSSNLEVDRAGEPVRVFVEAVAPPPSLIVIGATQTALPLIRMAHELDFHVTVVDPREVFAAADRLQDADEVIREWPDRALESMRFDENTYVVALTHDEKFDLPTLRKVLRSDVGYIGALGSRRTHAKRLEKLREEGFTEAELVRIHSPVGLDLGGRAPAEIALSVIAEITAIRYGRAPRIRPAE